MWCGIPCGATEKDGDPCGRIVHDYGFFLPGSYSVNAAHADTSVRYDSIRKRVRVLDEVLWYIKADLQSGFRQFGTHPADWKYQVYCNGPNEHYVDIACPFGKTNGTLEFCPPVRLFALSVAIRWNEACGGLLPTLSSYIDDIYGGIPHCESFSRSLAFRDFICSTGERMSFVFNRKPRKTPMPAKKQVILGFLFDSETKRMKSSEKKIKKYVARIDALLDSDTVLVRTLVSLHGNLNFASNVAPFGTPFLAVLTNLVAGRGMEEVVSVNELTRMSLRIWKKLLESNQGISYDFILSRLPVAKYNIFVDAASTWGIGGCYGSWYFKYSWEELKNFEVDGIARQELLAALVALVCFAPAIKEKMIILWTDNSNVCNWLTKGRSSKLKGLRYLALWELEKYKAKCKITTKWLPSAHNVSADSLSRGITPNWLQREGVRRHCDLQQLFLSWKHVEESWVL